jgi:hypothetical protein
MPNLRGAWHDEAMVFQLVAVALVVMGLAHTISRERIFAPLRERIGDRDTWLGYFMSCPYCLSHWIAFAVVPVTKTYPIDVPYDWGFVSSLLRWFLSSILVTVIAAFFRIGFYFIDESQGLIRRRQKVVELDLEDAGHHEAKH